MLSFDFETFPIGPGCLAPKPVCLAVGAPGDPPSAIVVGNGDDLQGAVEDLLDSGEQLTGHGLGFDLAVVHEHFPDLRGKLWAALDAERFEDLIVREKLLRISTSGDPNKVELPSGQVALSKRWKLHHFVKDYLDLDISAGKEDEDSVRFHFDQLDGWRAEDYPEEHRRYVEDDVIYPLHVYAAQQKKVRTEDGPASLGTAGFQTSVLFALQLMSVRGLLVDQAEKRRVERLMEIAYHSAETNRLLIEAGVMIPGSPARPYKGQIKRAVELIGGADLNGDEVRWEEHREMLEEQGVRFVEPKRPVIKEAPLHALVEGCWSKVGREPKRTDTGRICVDGEVQEELRGVDPTLDQFIERKAVEKLVTTYLPAMDNPDGSPAETVHPNFYVPVSSGRTASGGAKRGSKDRLYATTNGQNQDPRIRPCYVPRPGFLFFSVDYSGLELVSLAHTCVELFGRSELADTINAGIKPHDWLASQIALALHDHFRGACKDIRDDSEAVYERWMACKRAVNSQVREFVRDYYKLAKATGLGYPGGLGPRKFVFMAKSTYGVHADEAQARTLREIWFNTYPEMRDYFDYVNERCQDSAHPPRIVTLKDGTERKMARYAYRTPLGMWRANAAYTDTTNGLGMQSPSADGAKLATFAVSRACHDPSLDSPLLGRCHPLLFIHDEVFGEVPEDLDVARECVAEVQRLMEEPMQEVLYHVQVKTEPALMRRWRKDAEAVYDDEGRLCVWEPPAAVADLLADVVG